MSELLNEVLEKQDTKRRVILQRALFMQGASLAHFGEYEEARLCFQKLINQGCPWGQLGMKKLKVTINRRRSMTEADKAVQQKQVDELRQAWLNGPGRKYN